MRRLAASGAAVAAVAFLALPAAADVINGTPHADDLHGTSGHDVISGRGGADSVAAGKGNDVLYGGRGADFLIDGGGDDVAKGGGGADIFNVRRGADTIFGGVGKDYVLLYHDGSPDLVNCGPGSHDFVQYTGALESHDEFPGCERVEAYTP